MITTKFLKYYLKLPCVAILLFIITGCSFHSKVMIFRKAFDKAGENINSGLAKHITTEPASHLNVRYEARNTGSELDIYYPPGDNSDWKKRPAIVWIHGGGWIAGDKDQIANYCKILAMRGYTIAAINYSLAPEKLHPYPVAQINNAIGFLSKNNAKYHFNSKRIVIAGDSGGAQIAGELGIVLTDSTYAKKLGVARAVPQNNISGMILYCGIYDFKEASEGKESVVLSMMLRAYSGRKNYQKYRNFNLGSLVSHIPDSYPPTFISVGNKDILKEHTYALAKILVAQKIQTDSLFFEAPDMESSGHEYQFDLDTKSGKLALERTIKFLENLQ